MNIYTLHMHSTINIKEKLVACIGYFDGLHRGHQALVKKVISKAHELQAVPTMISFYPDPWVVIKDIKQPKHITTMDERYALAAKLGIKNFIVLDFTKEVADLSPHDFIHNILGQLSLQALICGFDFHFGRFGRGNSQYLIDECNYPIYTIEEVKDHDEKISSTRICKALQEGKIEEVNRLLGRDYMIEGKVIHGLGNGHKLGYPTANIDYSDELLLPKSGIYGGYLFDDGKKKFCMISLGHNPSIKYQNRLSLEVNIFDFDKNIYGQTIAIYWLGILREEMYFAHKDNLIEQLEKDKEEVLKKWK